MWRCVASWWWRVWTLPPATGRAPPLAGLVTWPAPSPAQQRSISWTRGFLSVLRRCPAAAAQDGLPAPVLPAALLLPGHGLLGLGSLAQRRLRVLAPPPGGPLPALRGEYRGSSSSIMLWSPHPDHDPGAGEPPDLGVPALCLLLQPEAGPGLQHQQRPPPRHHRQQQ